MKWIADLDKTYYETYARDLGEAEKKFQKIFRAKIDKNKIHRVVLEGNVKDLVRIGTFIYLEFPHNYLVQFIDCDGNVAIEKIVRAASPFDALLEFLSPDNPFGLFYSLEDLDNRLSTYANYHVRIADMSYQGR